MYIRHLFMSNFSNGDSNKSVPRDLGRLILGHFMILGYDPVFANILHDGLDPGLKRSFLKPTKPAEDGTTRFEPQNFIEARDNLR